VIYFHFINIFHPIITQIHATYEEERFDSTSKLTELIICGFQILG